MLASNASSTRDEMDVHDTRAKTRLGFRTMKTKGGMNIAEMIAVIESRVFTIGSYYTVAIYNCNG